MSAANENAPVKPENEKVCADLERELVDGLDAYAAAERDRPDRADAIRRILRDWLKSHGYLRSALHEEGTRLEDLNSSNDG